jgi:hypothetical protein
MTQIPQQTVFVDSSCNVIVPDFRDLFDVYDNCTNVTISQFPDSGFVINEPSAVFTVDILAEDAYGNGSYVTFNVQVVDAIAPTIRYIGDTIVVYHENELNQVITAREALRTHYGDTTISRNFRVFY